MLEARTWKVVGENFMQVVNWQFNTLPSEREKSESEAMTETEGENGAVDEILGDDVWKTRVQGKMRV